MNWKFTRKQTPIVFERDEPFCMIFPLKHGLIEEVEPKICSIEVDKEVQEVYTAWANSRRAFNENLSVPGSQEQSEKWQKDYFKGTAHFGACPPDHRTKLRAKAFKVTK
jgi:hypothetical protein